MVVVTQVQKETGWREKKSDAALATAPPFVGALPLPRDAAIWFWQQFNVNRVIVSKTDSKATRSARERWPVASGTSSPASKVDQLVCTKNTHTTKTVYFLLESNIADAPPFMWKKVCANRQSYRNLSITLLAKRHTRLAPRAAHTLLVKSFLPACLRCWMGLFTRTLSFSPCCGHF